MDITKLIKPSTCAKQRGLTTTRIHQLIKAGTLECVLIDGVKFINCENCK